MNLISPAGTRFFAALRHFIELPGYRVMLPKMSNSSKYKLMSRIAVTNDLRPA